MYYIICLEQYKLIYGIILTNLESKLKKNSKSLSSSFRKYKQKHDNNENNELIYGDDSIVNNENSKEDDTRQSKCNTLTTKHKVVPGISWGSLTKKQEKIWMHLKCDEFYCEPNQLAGRGIYKCIPLSNKNRIT
jgi:hypothetical protein